MVSVKHLGGEEWLVTVKSERTTEHRVRVIDVDLRRLGEGRSTEELLRASFAFLLEREPNTSILPSFDLSVINRYFPEFEKQIQGYLD